MSIFDRMTPKELYDWEWQALPKWARIVSWLVGLPSFAVLVWSAFGNSVSETLRTVCFVLFAGVSLTQIYCLNRIARAEKNNG